MQTCYFIKHWHQVFLSSLIACFFSLQANALAIDSIIKPKSATIDTTKDRYGFQSLFNDNHFDATKPYTAQLNPRAVSFVQEYMRKQGKELERMKTWGKPYFDLYDNILALYGIPKEMKYLSVIESHLQSGLVSWAGAVGPWQLMDYEAKRFGLRVGFNDERMDFNKSTHVAAKLMRELYTEFGDWLLVVAAYNGGAGRVRQCIRKAGSRSFWDLQYFLPEETRNHVKKFIATHYVFEGGGGWTTLTAEETVKLKQNIVKHNEPIALSAEETANTELIEISGRYNSLIVASALVIDIQQFNKWNPGFDKALSEGKKFSMRLPKEKLAIFSAKKNQLLMESFRLLVDGGH
ncbi:MAG: lytic transglycosylase domain-containing protein [Sediminibacterium sp.]|jgi:membrane-bound lytic murein transglycosylase D